MALAVLTPERVVGYAEQWRLLARGWSSKAGKEHSPNAARLRHMAQMALYAAYEAEQLLRREQRSGGSVPPVVQRHGPVEYVTAIGPVSLAGQRPRARGTYSTRITGVR